MFGAEVRRSAFVMTQPLFQPALAQENHGANFRLSVWQVAESMIAASFYTTAQNACFPRHPRRKICLPPLKDVLLPPVAPEAILCPKKPSRKSLRPPSPSRPS